MFQATPDEDRSDLIAVRAPARFGSYLGWGLLSVGVLWGSSRALDRIAEGPATTTSHAGAILEGLAIALATGLAGWTATVAWRLAVAVITDRVERRSRADDALVALGTRAVAAFERLADALERRPVADAPTGPPEVDRSRRLAEIDQALRSGRRGEAESLLDDLAVRFPDDPVILDLRERLDAARRQDLEESLAQLQAARQVNDPARVLELYRGLEPSLDSDRRGDLERELSRWFLELIHRRLRGGRIQPDVVELATMVAETFTATVEGASLRASLPTLRRSVGLCPRCAKPYVGTAAACPQCLGGASGAAETGPAGLGSEPDPDPDDLVIESPTTSGDGQDAGWMFYDENDRHDPDSPA